MTIDVALPMMLADSVGGRSVRADAATVADVLAALAAHPRLGPLMFDDTGALRPHVLVFHNDTSTRHLATPDTPLRPGDRMAVVQAVSGG